MWIFSEENWTKLRNWKKRLFKFIILSGIGTIIIYYILSSCWLAVRLNAEQKKYLAQYEHASWYSSNWGFYRLSNKSIYVINDNEYTWEDEHAEEVFRKFMYQGNSYDDLMFAPKFISFLIFLGGMISFTYLDMFDLKRKKAGIVLRGGRKVSCNEFIKIINEEDLINNLMLKLGKKEKVNLGVGFKVHESEKEYFLQIKKEDEPTHFLIIGDNGTGKSQLLFQLLCQIRDRGETAIVYDPAREFVRTFYDKERGDVILNPLDRRSPFWEPASEITAKGEAETVAKSLFPETYKGKGDFFVEKPRELFCELMKDKASVKELLRYMSEPELLDARFEGTRFAAYIDPKAAAQRNGILSSFSNIAKSLEILQEAENSNKKWSAAEWAKERKGWIFITSTPQSRDALLPLISCWMDCLTLRLMGAEPTFAKANPTWIVADELQTLERLRSLETALTESRKANVRMVIGFQGKAQIEQLYEKMSEVMLSQPSTKVFLRTTEPKAAEWISSSLGEVEIERLRSSTNEAVNDRRDSINSEMARQKEHLVIASEIMGLAKLEGFLKYNNLVVNIKFKPRDYEKINDGFIEREIIDKQSDKKEEEPPSIKDSETSVNSVNKEDININKEIILGKIEEENNKKIDSDERKNTVEENSNTENNNQEEKKSKKRGRKKREEKENLDEKLIH
ncbi:MAG: type IV secretion system DNA-binding domain-containing protein [Thaumarchaeota archaeon]|nr:type IV secretion system DNA-binding domain-containing protein [Nitrososphaerota archaeon]